MPFYKPYGMSDEEYHHEINIAEQKSAEWEQEQLQEEMERQKFMDENGLTDADMINDNKPTDI